MPLLRIPGCGPSDQLELGLTERQIEARRQLHEAIAAVGGLGSPAGSCVWHVLGCERSVREWAQREGWGGRPIGHAQAQGILIATLGVLAQFYGPNSTNMNKNHIGGDFLLDGWNPHLVGKIQAGHKHQRPVRP